MTLSDLFLLFLFFSAAISIWQHHRVRKLAYNTALKHTRSHEVLLLDESMVLRRIRFVKSHNSMFAMERQFEFEFSSLGDERYKGELVMVGLRQKRLWLQPFKSDFKGEPLE